MKTSIPLTLLLLTMTTTPGAALASGGDSGSQIPQGAPTLGIDPPEVVALQQYNRALKYRDKARKLEERAEELTGEARQKLDRKVEAQFEKAIGILREAVENNPRLFQAYSSLGYALRRTGQYEESLRAYDNSLELNPNYSEAIEYRGEAYLALNRPLEARHAYLTLKALSPEYAGGLSWLARGSAS